MSTQSSLVFVAKNSSSIGYNDNRRVHWYIPKDRPTYTGGYFYQHMVFSRNSKENEVRHRKARLSDLGVISYSPPSPYPDTSELFVETQDSSTWRRHKIWRSGENLVWYNLYRRKTYPADGWRGTTTELVPLPDSYETGIVDLISYSVHASPNDPGNLTPTSIPKVTKFQLNNSLQYLWFKRGSSITLLDFGNGVGASIFDMLDARHQIPDGALSQCFRDATDGLRITAGNVANAVDILSLAKDIYSAGPFGFAKHIKRNTKALQLGAKLAPEIIDEITRRCPNLAAKKLLTNAWTRKISDSWLWYRYAYSTTKMDLEEIHKKCKSLSIDESGPHTIRNGMALSTGMLRCKACVTKYDADPASELALRLYEYGLQIDGYAVWDLVPGSFVVDWFSNIGSKLEDKSQDFIRPSAMFSVSPVLFSWKYTEIIEYDGAKIECTSYTRWLSDPPPFEYFDEDPSTGTVIRRFFDGIALTIGGFNHHQRP